MRVIVVMLGLLVPASSLPAQRNLAPPDSLDGYIQREMRGRRIPGLALAIARNGRILTAKGYGLADVQNDVPTRPETRFELASITKQFTAAAILLLVEEGKVDLDASIATYLPDIPEGWKPITIRHLLTHTSGLPPLGEGFTGFRAQFGFRPINIPTALMYDAARADTLRFPPGERYLYSDVGYFLLGVITEKASGVPWRDFVRQRVFESLAMTDTYVLDQVRIHKNEARGYTIRDGDLVNIRRIRQYETPSHFGIFSHVHDLVKWDAALYTDRFLSATSRAEMWTPVRLADGSSHPYGFGWRVWRQRGHAIQQHRGITGTEIVRLPEDTLVIVVLTNLGSGPGINNQGIALEIAEMMLPTLRRAPLVETPVGEAELRRFVGKYSSGERLAEISIERGRLHLTPPGASRSVELVFQGNNTFEARLVDRRVVFEAERRGEISGYTVFSRGDVPPVRFVRADRQR